MDAITIIPLSIATYFLVAAFVPRIRIRWGIRVGPKKTVLQPHMGTVSCLGAAIFVGTFSLPTLTPRVSGDWIERAVIIGFALFFIGGVIDSLRERTIRRRK